MPAAHQTAEESDAIRGNRCHDRYRQLLENQPIQSVAEAVGAILQPRPVDDLDHHGDWRVEPAYGAVWVPRAVAAGWARLAPLYEFVSLDARDEFFKDSRTRVSEDHAKLMKFAMSHTMHAPGSPALAKRVWPEYWE